MLACLVEKAQTTPDSYPLTTNALRAACNQTTNRDPVVDYSEREVDAVMLELRELGLARTVTGSGHRVGKHKHIVDEALGLDGHELAVLTILVLRGPQTLNEVTTRTERYADGPAGDRNAVEAAIDRLASRPEPLAVRRDRQPGEREPRVDQCWVSPHEGAPTPAPAPALAAAEPVPGPEQSAPPPAPTPPGVEARVAALEAEVARLRAQLDDLLAQLGD